MFSMSLQGIYHFNILCGINNVVFQIFIHSSPAVSFDKLLKESDFLIVSCALTNETRHIFNAQTFKMMKKSAILINTSR